MSFSWVISYPMIFLAFPKSIILNFLMSLFFSHFKASKLLEIRAKLSTYTLIMICSSFHYLVKIHISALMEVKPILLKNLVIILFQSCLACFKS